MASCAEFESGHQDVVTVTKFNFYGNRILTASSDHRVKVWDQHDDRWELTDTWRAHDAEIRDAAWNGPFTGQHLGTVGEDMKFKLWQEDVTQAPNSGRRFRLCFILKSSVRTPFVSMDFRNIDLDSWIALITRDGFLTVLEPVDSDKLSDWQNMDSFRVCPEPVRGEETSFKVQFHHDPMDMTHILMPGWDRRSLSLVVAAMDLVRIFRTDSNRRFYQAIELAGHGGLVRDIAWAPGSIRGYDLVASGCKDGYVRVWEVHTKCSRNAAHKYLANNNDDRVPQRSSLPSARHVDSNSGITSALKPAGGNRAVDLRQNRESCFTHIAKEAAKIDTKHMDVWQVDFSKAGDCLLSTGDDGIIRFWKRSISGDWLEFAETDMGN